MSVIDVVYRTIACNGPECPNKVTFNQQEANTPDGNTKLLEENPWLKNMRVVQNPTAGKNFAYCSDICEVAGVAEGVHNAPD